MAPTRVTQIRDGVEVASLAAACAELRRVITKGARQRAFTLIELLVVIAIIGILVKRGVAPQSWPLPVGSTETMADFRL